MQIQKSVLIIDVLNQYALIYNILKHIWTHIRIKYRIMITNYYVN